MRAVLLGKPVPVRQAVCTGHWNGSRFLAYITGNALLILDGSYSLLQAIYDDSGDQLQAIVFDETNGKIAVSTEHAIRIYKPYGQGNDDQKWCLQNSFDLEKPTADNSANYLSWGIADELLVSNSYIKLFSTLNTQRVIWKSKLANSVRFAEFSHDSAFIASAGRYDRFVKIWRRLSFGSDDTRFDFSYLPHPTVVTTIQWRKSHEKHHTVDNVLYTTCADQVLRIWVAIDSHDHSTNCLQLWGQIDLTESIKPRALSKYSSIRYLFFIDGQDFTLATEQAVATLSTERSSENYSVSHLIEVSNRSPEICIILDDLGHMSAWGLESISYRNLQKKKVFNIAHVDGIELDLPSSSELSLSEVRCYTFFDRNDGGLNVLIHHFDGRIEAFEGNLTDFFDPSPRPDRLRSKNTLTGHSARIKNIVSDIGGLVAISRTDCNENIVWKQIDLESGPCISRKCSFTEQNESQGVCAISKGNYVISLLQDKVSLWDARSSEGKLISSHSNTLHGKPSCLFVLLEVENEAVTYVAAVFSKMNGIVWKIQLPSCGKVPEQSSSITEFCSFQHDIYDDVKGAFTINSAGSIRPESDPVIISNKDIVISYDHSGVVHFWAIKLDLSLNRVDWIETCSVNTGLSDIILASGNTQRKIAILDSKETELTIWDTQGNQLEYCQNYESKDIIQHLNWTLTYNGHSILAVGFPFRIIFLAQMPYNYLQKSPSWAVIREFDIRNMTPHPTGDLAWISPGILLIGSGNQLFILDKFIDLSSPIVMDLHLPYRKQGWDVSKVIDILNCPLPVYHPQFILLCLIARKDELVRLLILQLYKTLKYFVEGDIIDNYLSMNPQDFYLSYDDESTANTIRASENFIAFSGENDEVETVTDDVVRVITEKLAKISLPGLSSFDKEYLQDVIRSVAAINSQKRSIDENAALFMYFFHLNTIRQKKENKVPLSWREFNWAYHSNSQDILVNTVSRQFSGRLLWENARESGIFTWIRDPAALRTQLENIARNEYTKTDMKNPIDCTLFYLALRKKTVLQGLWRMAAWNREQAATLKFLANNFGEKKWKTAAMKNAYALLGKHRYEYAAAFFLLADCLKDAVNVILTQIKDLQLAIAIARVYEGDEGPVFLGLLQNAILRSASQDNNKWLASWAFWILQKKDMSLQTLLSPVYTLLDITQVPRSEARSFLKDDPALLFFYSQLRKKITSRSSCITSKMEWELVLHYTRSYCRLGCDILALSLVHDWKFLPVSTENATDSDIESLSTSPRRRLDIKEEIPSLERNFGPKFIGHKKTPALYEEPKSSSLLDNFGF